MLAKQLIRELQEMIDKRGNMEILITSEELEYPNIEALDFEDDQLIIWVKE